MPFIEGHFVKNYLLVVVQVQ